MAREAGFKGIVTAEGSSVVPLARRYRPDAITLDIGLPDMDGFALLDLLKHNADTRHIPIHVISGIDDTALSLNIGAYGAEVVRGAIQAVPLSQREAARALSFTPRQMLWRISIPQAIPEMMPSFGNLAVQNLKDTALVSLISLGDLAFRAEQIRTFTQDSTTVYSLLLLMYFGMALVLTAIMHLLERSVGRWRIRRP
jgi:ABC-type amino acid transport system permease subunit